MADTLSKSMRFRRLTNRETNKGIGKAKGHGKKELSFKARQAGYTRYSPIDATKKTDGKTSNLG